VTSLFLVDDHPEVRQRVGRMLGAIHNVLLVGEASDVTSGLDGIRRLRPDVVVVDFHLGADSGLSIVEAVKQEFPGMRVIVLSNFLTPQHVARFKRAGAHWCFDKSSELDQVRRVVTEIAAGASR